MSDFVNVRIVEDAAIGIVENAYHDKSGWIVPDWAMQELRAALEATGHAMPSDPPAGALFEGE